jgi:hypothetical protein
MNVTLCSMFRNMGNRLYLYIKQIEHLSYLLRGRGDCVHFIWCEGDSTDETSDKLRKVAASDNLAGFHSIDLFQYHHGGPEYGSVVNATRFANLAKVCNAVWQRVPQDADVVLWVESDLIWEPDTMVKLIDSLSTYPAVSPMVLLKRDGYPPGYFYDNWAARKNGVRIGTMPPYFPGWDMVTPLEVDSAGSVLAIRGDLARQVTWPEEDVIVGLCRQISKVGGRIWVNPNLKVVHL